MQKSSFHTRSHSRQPRRAHAGGAADALRHIGQHRGAQTWTASLRWVKPMRTARVPASPASLAPPAVSARVRATTDTARSEGWKTLLMGAALLSVACPVVVARSMPSYRGSARSRDGASVNSDFDMAIRQRYLPATVTATVPSVSVSRLLGEMPGDAATLTRPTHPPQGPRVPRALRAAGANDTIVTAGAASLLSQDWLSRGNLTDFLDGPVRRISDGILRRGDGGRKCRSVENARVGVAHAISLPATGRRAQSLAVGRCELRFDGL